VVAVVVSCEKKRGYRSRERKRESYPKGRARVLC
jgi:hypothetical protein